MLGLRETLQRHVEISSEGRDSFFDIDDTFCLPGFWTSFAARARARHLSTADLALPLGKIAGYAHTIGIEHALGEQDTYQYDRKNAGNTYSPLVLLENPEMTEQATGEINSCIRRLFDKDGYGVFVRSMCELVGDLLDNVWSHGKSTGFSMAQRWSNSSNRFHFEFAVSDCGYGFLRELQRAGMRQYRFRGRAWL